MMEDHCEQKFASRRLQIAHTKGHFEGFLSTRAEDMNSFIESVPVQELFKDQV